MRTRQSYLVRSERRKERFARARKRKEEIRLANPAPDYPPVILPGTLIASITLRLHRVDRVKVIELRQPIRARSDQYSVSVDGTVWPKHGRAVGIAEVRSAIAL